MDIKNLKEKKDKKEYTAVRINLNLYKELKLIAKHEKVTIIRLVEFFLKSAIKEYNKSKSNKKKVQTVEDYEQIKID